MDVGSLALILHSNMKKRKTIISYHLLNIISSGVLSGEQRGGALIDCHLLSSDSIAQRWAGEHGRGGGRTAEWQRYYRCGRFETWFPPWQMTQQGAGGGGAGEEVWTADCLTAQIIEGDLIKSADRQTPQLQLKHFRWLKPAGHESAESSSCYKETVNSDWRKTAAEYFQQWRYNM